MRAVDVEKLVVGIAPTVDPLAQCGGLYEEAVALLEGMGARVVKATRPIAGAEDAQAACTEFEAAGVDLAILMCCRLVGDGAVVAPFMRAKATLAVWCLPEPTATGPLMLNAMTATNLYMSAAAQMAGECGGKRAKWLYGAPSHPLMEGRLAPTVAALRAQKRLRGGTLVQFGSTPAGFTNLGYSDAAIKARFGATVARRPLDELFAKMDAADPAAVAALAAGMKGAARHSVVQDIEIEKNARLVLAVEACKEELGAAAFAIACWPEFQADLNFSTCLAFAWLNERGIAVSCEGDLPGALSMLVAQQVAAERPMLMDPVAMDTETDAFCFWHCGMGMPCYADGAGCAYTKYPCDPRILDLPGVSVDVKFAPRPVTICRFGGAEMDEMLACQAHIVEGPGKGHDGARGWFSQFTMAGRPLSAADFFNTACVSGNPHHYIICAGHSEAALREFAARCGVKAIEAAPCGPDL